MAQTSNEEAPLLGGVEPSWPELVGCNNWERLLDPLNLHLRRLILRCGDFCQATYDAFDHDVKSMYAGSSRYGKKHFFHKVMLDSAADYQVECFLYATADGVMPKSLFALSLAARPWDRLSNFMGYIATTTDEVSKAMGRREIYVVWRGTVADTEWKAEEFNQCLKSADKLLANSDDVDDHRGCCCSSSKVKVMGAWLKIYLSSKPNMNSDYADKSASSQLHRKIQELREKYINENLSIIVTGHSLGASLAVLSAFDLAENRVRDIPVSAIVFACPKVGNRAFQKRANSLPNLKILHIKNKHDWIPCVPFWFLGYVDTGITLKIDNDKSPHLKITWDPRNFWDWHNLEAMLHVIAGWNGAKGEFDLKVKRSLALVNKSCDLLKGGLIPASWWVEKNKGLVRRDDGEWVYATPSDEDKPVPEFSS